MKKLKAYALYKGERMLGMGTMKELAEMANVTEKTLRFWMTPAYQRRLDKRKKQDKARKVVCLGYDDE